MGNNSLDKTKYNEEKDVKLDITLNKICYLPGEKINGSLDIKPIVGYNETILNETNVTIKLIQIQYYEYWPDDYSVEESDEKDIQTENFDFVNFKGANFLSEINIPFSIQIPLAIHASVIWYSESYVKHFLSVDFPGLKAKRSLLIIIKRFENYSNENKLLKAPAIAFGDFYKKKKFRYKGGKVTCLLKLPKNRFYYSESIPLEIYLNCTELNMEVKEIILKVIMTVYFNFKEDEKGHKYKDRIDLFTREYPVNISTNKYEIKDNIQLQKDKDFEDYASINDKYCLLEDMKKIEIDHKFEKMILMPLCFGGLINSEYSFQVEIIYKENRSKSTLSLPIDLVENNNDDINIETDNGVNKDNNSYMNNINSFDENSLK